MDANGIHGRLSMSTIKQDSKECNGGDDDVQRSQFSM